MIQTQLFINGVELDLSANINVPLTFSIADAKNPEKRKRSSSKTIKLPGTQRNNVFFQSAWDLAITDLNGTGLGFDFDPTIKYPAKITKGGVPIFLGTANLTGTTVTNGVNSYDVVLYSEITDLFQKLGDVKVSELGWSEYDHVLSVANIAASWVAGTGQGYVYPLIDYGFTDDLLSYLTNQLRPHLYVGEIVRKCFEFAGYTVDSDHFTSDPDVKKTIWGYGGGEPILLDQAEVDARQVSTTIGNDGEVVQFQPTSTDVSFPGTNLFFDYQTQFKYAELGFATLGITVNNDPTNQFDAQFGELVIGNNGNYMFRVKADLQFDWDMPSLGACTLFLNVRMRFLRNGAEVGFQDINIEDSGTGDRLGMQTLNFDNTVELLCDAGDILTVDFVVTTNGSYSSTLTGSDPPINFYLQYGFINQPGFLYEFDAINSGLVDGDTVQISRYLPDMRAADFLRDMITLYNLYMSEPDQDNVVKFDPIDDYYFDTTDTDNWTDKLDRAKPINIKAAQSIEGKTYNFRWAEDRDYYKNLYFETYGMDYGDKVYDVPSTFKKGEKNYTLKHAQSCPVQIEGTDIIIPRIVGLDETSLVSKPYTGKPRLYFYNGLQPCDDWDLVNADTLVATTYNTYPQAHHLNSLTFPTFDLNFGVPQAVYYTATDYTTNNLWEVYYQSYIRELTGRDAKLVNASFYLREDDFYFGFMRRLVNIDGTLYRKNIIKDYKAQSEETTKVELIRINEGRTRQTQTVKPPPVLEPAVGNVTGGFQDPITEDIKTRNNVTFYTFDTDNVGKDIEVEFNSKGLKIGTAITFKNVGTRQTQEDVRVTPSFNGVNTPTIEGFATAKLIDPGDSFICIWDGRDFIVAGGIGARGENPVITNGASDIIVTTDNHASNFRTTDDEVNYVRTNKQSTVNGGIFIDGELWVGGILTLV